MKKILLTLLCAASLVQGLAQSFIPTLDSNATISVLTCGSGNEFYTTFGHSAIRICDTAQDIDVVYNYGTFDFDTPHFYLTFARGRLNYCLSRSSFLNFMMEYTLDGREVWQQDLRLSQQEKQNLFILLETNYLPEYRYYKYDFFRDNCATRIRDIVSNSLTHRSLIASQEIASPLSYRQLLQQYTHNCLRWWQLGIDIVLGAPCDKKCTQSEYMFLPFELKTQLDTTCVSDTHQPLAQPARQILCEDRQPLARSISPTITFWALLLIILALTIIGWKKQWSLAWFDRILFFIAGLASIVIIFLWFFSDHYCTQYNWNILWASPLFLYLALFRKQHNRWVVYLQSLAFAALAVIAVAGWQHFNEAILPIALILYIRTINILKQSNK